MEISINILIFPIFSSLISHIQTHKEYLIIDLWYKHVKENLRSSWLFDTIFLYGEYMTLFHDSTRVGNKRY